jgi:hypothetical protein
MLPLKNKQNVKRKDALMRIGQMEIKQAMTLFPIDTFMKMQKKE